MRIYRLSIAAERPARVPRTTRNPLETRARQSQAVISCRITSHAHDIEFGEFNPLERNVRCFAARKCAVNCVVNEVPESFLSTCRVRENSLILQEKMECSALKRAWAKLRVLPM